MRRAAKKMKLSMEDSLDIEEYLTDLNGNTSKVKRKPKTPGKKVKIESKKMTPDIDSKSGKGRKRKTRCDACEGCLRSSCGKCRFCLDMIRFGGPNKLRQACQDRICQNRSFKTSPHLQKYLSAKSFKLE